jgi:hypothetical protein
MSHQDTPHQSQRKTADKKKSLQNQLGPIFFIRIPPPIFQCLQRHPLLSTS